MNCCSACGCVEEFSGSAMLELMDDVDEFEAAMGAPDSPLQPVTDPTPQLIRLRARLMTEEFMETIGAMFDHRMPPDVFRREIDTALMSLDHAPTKFDIEGVADGLADLIYVCVGAALAFGIPLDRVWNEVQRANLDKVGGGVTPEGKFLKPEGWQPPRIREAIFGDAA